jgi:dTDP-glucose 4,6-dehydratase
VDEMKILLTGASGFAGAHMLKYLVSQTQHDVVCPVTYRHGGHRNRIPSLLTESELRRVRIIEHDLANSPLPVDSSTQGVEMIINYASESHVDRSIANPIDFSLNNTNLMINLLEFARRMDKALFIHISTDEVYGSIPSGETNKEWERPHLPSNPYSASKSAQESLAISYFKTYKIPIAIINCTNMIGETQNQEKFLPKVINRIEHDYIVSIDTDIHGVIGSRKYIHVADVASAVWISALKLVECAPELVEKELPLKFHVSGSQEISNLDLANLVGAALEKHPQIVISPSPRPGYDLRYELTTDLIKSLGWEESRDITERISEIVNWTISNPEWLYIDYGDDELT